jgi:hypothetical protein
MTIPPSVVDKNPLSFKPDKTIHYATKKTKDASKANIRCLNNFYSDYFGQ